MNETMVQFYIRKRKNTFVSKGYEWEFNARIGDLMQTLCTFDLKPTKNQLKNTKDIIMRSFEFYHSHLRIPAFNMRDTSNENCEE